MPFTWIDIVVLVFMLISGMLAMARGFTREVLSILSWVAAALAALWLFPRFQDQARAMISDGPKWLADIILVFGIFLITLIIVTFITVKIADRVLDSRIGALDRTFGFLFGLARGLIIVVIAYLFFVWLVPEESMPDAVKEARARPVLDATGEMIRRILPEDPAAALSGFRDRVEEDSGEAVSEEPDAAPPQGADSGTEPRYKRDEQQELDQLLESTRER